MTATKPATKDIKRRDPDEDPPLVKLIRQYEPDLAMALPNGMTPDRFFSTITNLVRQNPQLLNAEPLSVVSSALLLAQIGLEPGAPLGLAHIIPYRQNYKDKNGEWRSRLVAQAQIGYPGYRVLAYRSQQVKHVHAQIVYEGDDFDYEYQLPTGWVVHFKPKGEPGRDWTHVFSAAETILGGVVFEVMTKAEVLAHRDRYVKKTKSGGFGKGWDDNEPEMARKTVVLRVCKQLPMSAELSSALVADGATPREIRPELAGVLALEASTEEEEEGSDDS